MEGSRESGSSNAARPRAAVPRACAAIAESKPFNFAIFAIIVANAIVLGLETYDGVTDEYGGLLTTLNDVFLGIFVVELAIRFTGYGSRPQDFFRSGWNVFDFVVIGGAFVPGLRENATLLRLLRLGRVLRLVRLLPDLRVLVVAVGRSLPGVASLAVVALLMIYVYGMVGWVIFKDHDPSQFGNIGDAMLTMFVMLSLETLPQNIEMGLELSDWTVIYFVSYALVASFLVLNLLIGVVINSMEEAREIEERRLQQERREHAAETDDPSDDREVAMIDHVAALRVALDELERDIRQQGGGGGHRPRRSGAGGLAG